MSLDVQRLRARFPALGLEDGGVPRLYLDNPAGTQVPDLVIERMRDYLVRSNANSGGPFRTSVETDALLDSAHTAMADLLNAPSPAEIVFGPNMTTLTYQLSRSITRTFEAGDAVLVTRMDHDANVAPWLQAAADHGLEVRWLDFGRDTFRYDLAQLEPLLDGRVRLAAVNYASNAIGTVNDVKAMTRILRGAGALVFVDAVQFVPHGLVDVQDVDCDFLVCSAYKFFGPHQGVLWGRRQLLEELPAYKVRPASDAIPHRFETGTQSHEGQAGTLGAVEYLTWIGETSGEPAGEAGEAGERPTSRRQRLCAAMVAIAAYERELCAHLISGLQAIPGLKVYGITAPRLFDLRVPTVSFTLDGLGPAEIAAGLARENIYVWHGDYYALEVVRHLGLEQAGGMLRVGLAHYNTAGEVDRLLEALRRLPR